MPDEQLDVHDVLDVLVVGAGPAGMNCALECHDIQLDTVVFEATDDIGGQVNEIHHSVRNVAAGRFADGRALQEAMDESAAILGPRLRRRERITRVDAAARFVELDDGTRIHGRTLVIATGTARQELAPAPDGAFGGDVTYQIDATPERFAGFDVVVIGGGDSATLDALELARHGSRVRLVHRAPALTARDDIIASVRDADGIDDLAGWELEAVHGGDHVEAVTLKRAGGEERMRTPARGVVVKIARVPRTEIVRGEVDVDRTGAIVVDDELRTSRPGVFAAGDVVSGAYPRVAAALGHGSLAARSVLRHIQGRA
jgi:thioredoxin reductase (NADPH)